tara:strand:- start:473 stop:1363 length:891 start_codon:yes stop_codon:yes gene_type:complete
MKRILENIYLLSKFTVSFTLLCCLFVSLYVLYNNYKDEEISYQNRITFDQKLSDKISKNSALIENISKDISNNKVALNDINNNLKDFSNENKSSDISNLTESVSILKKNIEFLLIEIENLKKINSQQIDNNKSSNNTILKKSRSDIIDLIKIRYENNLGIDQEIDYLRKISNTSEIDKIEKLSILSIKTFKGHDYLIKTFDKEVSYYLKKIIEKDENSLLNKFVLPYVNISPSSENKITDDFVILLKAIKKDIVNKKFYKAYNKIINIDNYDVIFSSSFQEIQKYINFNNELSKLN